MATVGYFFSMLVLLALGAAVIAFLLSIRRVPADHAGVVERLGRRHRVCPAGRVVLMPFVDRLILVDLRPRHVLTQARTEVTADGAAIATRARLTLHVTDPGAAACFGDPELERVAQAAITALLSDVTREDALIGRAALSARLRNTLATGTAEWGYQLDAVELEFGAAVESLTRR